MRNSIIVILVIAFFCLFSCKKDKDQDNTNDPETTYPNFAQLKVGNYWVYEIFNIDSIGNATSSNKFDSCYIEKDTTINNLNYFVFRKTCSMFITPTTFIHDSLHYVVDNHGKIIFSSQDFTSIFYTTYTTIQPNDTASENSFKMDDKNVVVSTPYGSFTTYNFKETCNIYPDHVVNTNTRYWNTRYAENVGIVTQSIAVFLYSQDTYERRLVRYHLN